MTITIRCDCGASLAASPGVPITCRHCSTTHGTTGPTRPVSDDLPPIHAAQRSHICEACPERRGVTCGPIVDRGRPGRIWHPRGILRPDTTCPQGRWGQGIPGTLPAFLPYEHVAIITTHWNPNGFDRLHATYRDWLPHFTTAHTIVQTHELTTDEHPPEIPQAIHHRGDLLWQKERLLNLAIVDLPASVKYVAWIDHDLVPTDPHWLRDSIKLLQTHDAVQPFAEIDYLDRFGRRERSADGAVALIASGRRFATCPGGVWIARRDYLDSIPGGIYDRHIVGGGDSTLLAAMTGTPAPHLDRCPPGLADDARRWLATAPRGRITHLPTTWRHLWHGDRTHRQYSTRDAILTRHRFDPAAHLITQPGRPLQWSPQAPAALRAAIANYFRHRRDDG